MSRVPQQRAQPAQRIPQPLAKQPASPSPWRGRPEYSGTASMSVGGLNGVSLPSLPRLGQHQHQPPQPQPLPQHIPGPAVPVGQIGQVGQPGQPGQVGQTSQVGQPSQPSQGQPSQPIQPGQNQPGLSQPVQAVPPGQPGLSQRVDAGAPSLQQRYQVPMPFTPRYSSFRHTMPPGPAPGVGPVQVMGGSQFSQGMPPGMPPPMGQLHSLPQQPMPAPIQQSMAGGYPMRVPSMSGSFSVPSQALSMGPPPGAGAAPAAGPAAGFSPSISNTSNPLLAVLAGSTPATAPAAAPTAAAGSAGGPASNGAAAKAKESKEAAPSSFFFSTQGHPNFELLGPLPVPSLTVTPANGRESLAAVLPGLAPDARLRKREGSTVAATSSSLFDGSAKAVPLLQSLGIDQDEPAPAEVPAPRTMAASLKKPDIDRYGLRPLLGVLRMESGEANHMILDMDVTHLGLNLNDPSDRISRTFASPWLEASKHCVVPEFGLPECYTVHSAVPQQQKLQNLTEETLFYIFYTMPKDAMQEAAAVELTNRNWRYHKELKLWLTKDPMSDPVQQTAQAESGIYVFFDPISWEKVKKEYFLYYPDIA